MQLNALNDRSLIVFAAESGRGDFRPRQKPGDAFIAAKQQKAGHRWHDLAAVICGQQQMTFKYFGGWVISGALFVERAAFKGAHENPKMSFSLFTQAHATG